WRPLELPPDDSLEDEVAQRPVSRPALERRLVHDEHRTRLGMQPAQRLEPLDPAEAVPDSPRPLRRLEVVEEHVRVGLLEAERAEALERLVRRQAAASS